MYLAASSLCISHLRLCDTCTVPGCVHHKKNLHYIRDWICERILQQTPPGALNISGPRSGVITWSPAGKLPAALLEMRTKTVLLHKPLACHSSHAQYLARFRITQISILTSAQQPVQRRINIFHRTHEYYYRDVFVHGMIP
jgi:hypothetical protein